MELTDEKVAPVAGHPSDEGVRNGRFSLFLHVGHTENLDNGLWNFFFGGARVGGDTKAASVAFQRLCPFGRR
jgi:hypothetical protein